MILGLGADIVCLSRISRLIERRGFERFSARILSDKETVYLSNSTDRERFMAVRWAVKEAAYKAMYPTVKPTWKDLTYVPFGGDYPGSKPRLVLCDEKRGVVDDILVSVSHDGDYVFASVIAIAKSS